MEEDQKLFDMCTQEFNKQLQMESDRDEERQRKWELVERQAKTNMQVIKFKE
jgi:hypothetical protein